jgi:hypothetical protein
MITSVLWEAHMADVYSDKGAHLASRFGDDVPEQIKTAAFLDDEVRAGLPDTAYAYVDGNTRELPLVDAGNVAMSTIYFLDGKSSVPEDQMRKVANRLVTACGEFELAPPKPLLKLAETKIEKKAELTVAPTDENFERAVAFFMEKGAEYEPARRREISQEFVKTATALHVEELPDVVVRYASNYWNPELSTELEVRAAMLKMAGDLNGLEMLGELETVAFQCDIEKFAEALYDVDQRTGLVEHYDTRLTDAFLATFGMPNDDLTGTAEELKKFAASQVAKDSFDGDVLTKLAEDPGTTLDAVDPTLRDLILMSFDEYLDAQNA